MMIPELPAFLSAMGGGQYKGLIISLFTVTAMLSRPFSGRLADTIGRVPVMIIGSAVCVFCSLLYPVISTVSGFLLLRFFHGFSTGFTPTGFTAYVADIIPPNRRGEAMGLLSTFGTLGMAGSPALGDFIAVHGSINMMFYGSAFLGLLSVLIFFRVKETVSQKQRFHPSHLKIGREDLYDPNVFVPCLIMLLTSYSFGAMLTLIPDLSDFLGLSNKGLVFMIFTFSSVLVRILAGKISDRFGRPAVLKVSITLIGVGMLVIGFASQPWMLWTGGVIYGLAYGTNSPTLFAWVTDLGNEKNKGRAFASLYIALECGIGLGAFGSGLIYGDDPQNFLPAFSVCSLFSLAALIFIFFRTKGRTLRSFSF